MNNDECSTCEGTGVVDSGGVTSWGAPIDVACPDCAPTVRILLDWTWDSDSDSLQASSMIFHDEGVPLNYCIEKRSATWDAFFEGAQIKTGTLEQCIAACHRSERQAKSSLKAYRDYVARRKSERELQRGIRSKADGWG